MKLTKKHLHVAIVSGALIAMGFIFLLKPHHVPKKEDSFAALQAQAKPKSAMTKAELKEVERINKFLDWG